MRIGNQFGANVAESKSAQNTNSNRQTNNNLKLRKGLEKDTVSFTSNLLKGKPLVNAVNLKSFVEEPISSYITNYVHKANTLPQGVRNILCPPDLFLTDALRITKVGNAAHPKNSQVEIYAQRIDLKGVNGVGSPTLELLDNAGEAAGRYADGVVINHKSLQETPKKVEDLLDAVLKRDETLPQYDVLLCVGENKGQSYEKALNEQVHAYLQHVSPRKVDQLVIANEDQGSIAVAGLDSKPLTPDESNTRIGFIKDLAVDTLGNKAKKIPVISGGSADVPTITQGLRKGDINGFFVGTKANTSERAEGIMDIYDKAYNEFNPSKF